jgi:hypothetical protein
MVVQSSNFVTDNLTKQMASAPLGNRPTASSFGKGPIASSNSLADSPVVASAQTQNGLTLAQLGELELARQRAARAAAGRRCVGMFN